MGHWRRGGSRSGRPGARAAVGRWALIAIAFGALAACGPNTIAGTSIEATDENIEIFDLVERYRRALEERDVAALEDLLSREYFDNAGTTDSDEDDYGFDHVRGHVLPVLRDNVKKIRVDVAMKDIYVQGGKATADFEYTARFLYTEGGKDGWITRTDYNRLEFVQENGAWRIVAGL